MAYDIGTISGSVTLKDGGYRKTLKNMESDSNDTFKRIASFAAGFLSVTALVQFGKKSIQTFSDLEEATSKFGVVFSGVMDKAEAGMNRLIDKYHFSELGAKEMLSGTGDLLTGFGFAQDTAFDYAQQVAELGADLASFSNYQGGAKGAAEALTKGMLGETESMKALGIVIRQDDAEFRNMVETLKQTKGYTEQQAKAEAVLATAIKQSKNAIGDYQRTADSLSNQMRRTGNIAQDALSAVGEIFVDAFDVGGIVKSFNDNFSDIVKYIKEHTTEWVYTFKVVFGKIVIGIEEMCAYIGLFLQPVFDWFTVGFKNIVTIGQWVYDNWSKIWANIGDIGKAVAMDYLDVWLYVPRQLISIFKELGKALWAALKSGSTDAFSTAWENIKDKAVRDFAALGSRTEKAMNKAGVSDLKLDSVDYGTWFNSNVRNQRMNEIQNKYAAKYAENERNAQSYLERRLAGKQAQAAEQNKVQSSDNNVSTAKNDIVSSFSLAAVNAMLGNGVQNKIAKNTGNTVQKLTEVSRKVGDIITNSTSGEIVYGS
ncbi:MAG: hypothetical protein IKB77_04635 [Lentisphaeria bacterium]|nr:hypothetical protein [Lentisphaeria bacterium]